MPPFISGLINGRNQISKSVTWGTSDLRKWLNGVFFRGTFSKNEQKLMRVSRILNDNSSFFGLAKPEYTGSGLRDWTAAVRFMPTAPATSSFWEKERTGRILWCGPLSG